MVHYIQRKSELETHFWFKMRSQLRTSSENKNALTISTVLFKQFPFRSVLLLVVPKFVRTRSVLFFRNDGIVLDRSVRSQERTIVPPGTRPALFAVPSRFSWRSLHVYYYCTASAMLSDRQISRSCTLNEPEFPVYCLSPVTVIVSGYICCIKRAGSTLLLVVQTGQYDWMPCTLYSTCWTGLDHATFRAMCAAVKSYDFTWTVPMIWNLFSLVFIMRGPPLSPAQGSWRNRFRNS